MRASEMGVSAIRITTKRKIRIILIVILILFVVAAIIIINILTIRGEVIGVDNGSIYISVDSGSAGKFGISNSAIIYWKDTSGFKVGDDIIIIFSPTVNLLTSDPPYVSGAKLIFKSPFK